MSDTILRGVDATNRPIILERRGDLIISTDGMGRDPTIVRVSAIDIAWVGSGGRNGHDFNMNVGSYQTAFACLKGEQIEWLVEQVFGKVATS